MRVSNAAMLVEQSTRLRIPKIKRKKHPSLDMREDNVKIRSTAFLSDIRPHPDTSYFANKPMGPSLGLQLSFQLFSPLLEMLNLPLEIVNAVLDVHNFLGDRVDLVV